MNRSAVGSLPDTRSVAGSSAPRRDRRRSILILGGGVMQLPAIRLAAARGWHVTVADGNPRAVGAAEADRFLAIDLKEREALEAAARALASEVGLDGVFTAGTDFSATVAWIAERLGLPGIGYQTALRATDKSLMRAAFRAAGVPSPDFVTVKVGDDPSRLALSLRYPLVVKPVDNMGARGIRRIDRPAELPGAVEAARSQSRSATVIVEEYIPGPEFSLDAIVDRDRITVTGIADRIIRFEPYFVEMGHTIPTAADDESVERLRSVFEAGIRALGITTGAAKGDIKLSPGGPVVGEIAARLSGGYMSGWTYPYSSGMLVTGAALNLAVGLPAGELAPRWRMVSAERAFLSIPGRVERVTGLEEAERRPFVKNLFLRVGRGGSVVFPTNNVEKCGNIISQAPTRKEAVASAESACRQIHLLLEPGNPDTAAFLFGGAAAWAPSAFDLGEALGGRADSAATAARFPLYEIVGGNTRIGVLSVFAGLGARSGVGAQATGAPGAEEGGARAETLGARDWQGRSIDEALAQVRELLPLVSFDAALPRKARAPGPHAAPSDPVSPAIDGPGILLGLLFRRAFLRGGVQGAVWLVESVARHIADIDVPSAPALERHMRELCASWGIAD